MSRLAEFRRLEKHLAEQMAALAAMKEDKGLQREVEFESKLRELLTQYSFSLRNVIAILDPPLSRRALDESKAGARRPRQVKVYKNPNTEEVVKTKGGNHKTLKEWKSEYGADTVESWLA